MRVLVLDGRGVPGLAILPALHQLEQALCALDGSLLNDAFDWIVGSSVGGIIAISLRDHKGMDIVQRVTIRLLQDEFRPPGLLSNIAAWQCKRKTGYRHRGIMLDARIFLRFLMQTIPDRTAVIAHDLTTGLDLLLDQQSMGGVRPAICSTMAEPGILPPRRQGKSIYVSTTRDPLSVFLEHHDPESLFVLSISNGTNESDCKYKCKCIRWQLPSLDIAFDDTSERSLSRVLNIKLDDQVWNGYPPTVVAQMIMSMGTEV